MKKPIIILIALILVIGGAAWYFATFHMDSVIKQKIETTASSSLGTQVSVGGVKTDIKGGSLTISNITIANPPGFENENAFSLNGIEAAVDYSNFEIKRVVIEKPEILVEEKGGKTNFDQILAGMQKQESAPAEESEPVEESEPSADAKEEQIIVIRHFRMNGSRASFESESMDHYSDLKIGAVELSNLKGTHSEISKVITNEIIKEITKAAAIELVKAKASEKLDELLGRDKD